MSHLENVVQVSDKEKQSAMKALETLETQQAGILKELEEISPSR